ncbi:uncharacterized protein LOC143288311 [Babylonia areolata]|uniref:uncharacterized protein LOC143288311 n=1 Tax=Babylonia areolata TaxID=304850 RepID=UPI003FD33578
MTRSQMMFVLGFLGWVSVIVVDVSARMTPSDSPALPTVEPTFYSNVTIGPTIKVNYTVEISTSGPAVLDSVIVFTARIFIEPNHTLPEGKFNFLWISSTNDSNEHTSGRHTSTLHKAFHHAEAIDYLMTVVVSSVDRPAEILTFSSTVFKLTENLNGNLRVYQDLEYQRSNTSFAIDQPIHFHVNITDHFSKSDTPQYTYFWYNGSDLIRVTDSPHLERNFSEPSILHLQAVASAQFWNVPGDAASPSSRAKPNPDLYLESSIPDKCGSFTEKLHFKESLSNCGINRVDSSTEDQSVKLGDTLVLNITCSGSSPSAVCWNVTTHNSTLNETCRPGGQFTNSTEHRVAVTMGSTGWNTLQIAVYNDISFQVMSQNYYVYDADSVNIPALVLPIVFIVLGGCLLAAGVTYIVRLRRKLHVEVADFDFDPTISVRSTSSWSNFVPAVKHFIQRVRHRAMSTSYEPYSINRPRNLYETL